MTDIKETQVQANIFEKGDLYGNKLDFGKEVPSKNKDDFLSQTNSSASERIKHTNVDISDEKYHKPFQYGWKRVVVVKNSSDSNKYVGYAVYYSRPQGKKVYSKQELSVVLKTSHSDLTVDNFVFSARPIGLKDPEKEIIRKCQKLKILKYLKPFQYGWKREIVKGVCNNVGYYTPAGEKIRLKRQLFGILEGTELTPDNFLFTGRSLGLNDPEKEIIRKSNIEWYEKRRKLTESPESLNDDSDDFLGPKSPAQQDDESVEVETERPVPLQKNKFTKIPRHFNDMLPIVTNPKYLEPFRYGWKRVVVTGLPKSWRKKVFVYYYRVGGKKFYKKARLAEILKDTELIPDHFIFRGVSLGLNDTEKETFQVFGGGLFERIEKVIKRINMTDPKFLKPFEYGWKREVVKSSCEGCPDYAFYYSPKGKKVYSKRELDKILTTNDLTHRNFVFLGKPIGLNDPEKEIIRKCNKRKMTETSDTELPSISNGNNSVLERIL